MSSARWRPFCLGLAVLSDTQLVHGVRVHIKEMINEITIWKIGPHFTKDVLLPIHIEWKQGFAVIYFSHKIATYKRHTRTQLRHAQNFAG